MSVGTIQLCLSIGSFSTLYPDCPSECNCSSVLAIMSYVCLGLGFLWLILGQWFERAAKAAVYMQVADMLHDDDDDETAIYMMGQGEFEDIHPLDPPPPYVVVEPA